MKPIPIAGPWITEREIRYVSDAVANAWYENHDAYQTRFENAFSSFVDRSFAISLPSCTSALHLALLAAGIGPGDEVVVPECTWIATAAPIAYVGATPVFADVDPESWCLTPDTLATSLTPRTKAVIVVDLYGNMPDMDSIQRIADRHSVVVIEDAAEAIGSEYRHRPAGSFGFASTFSFHGSKTLTTGEGGMLALDAKEACDRCRFLRDHGRRPGDRYFFNTEVGYKYKMSGLQAALGLAQLERIDELVARKREIFAWYRDGLDRLPGVKLNSQAPEVRNSYWMVTVVVSKEYGMGTRELMEGLAQRGIDSRPFFHPLSSLPAYRELPDIESYSSRNPIAYRVAARAVNLPSGFNLTPEMVSRVCRGLKEILGHR